MRAFFSILLVVLAFAFGVALFIGANLLLGWLTTILLAAFGVTVSTYACAAGWALFNAAIGIIKRAA